MTDDGPTEQPSWLWSNGVAPSQPVDPDGHRYRHGYRSADTSTRDVAEGDVPSGAGLVPARTDAVPPATPESPDQTYVPDPVEPPPWPPFGPPDPPAQPPSQAFASYPGMPYATAQPEPGAFESAPDERYQHVVQPPLPPVFQPLPSLVPPQQPAAPPAQPRPEDLLVPDRPLITDAPARWGWRGRIRRLTGGAVKPKAGSAELADRQSIVDIQRGFSRPMTVVVIQPKGGGGKTPTTIGLASALGSYRGGYVVGWDDNETRGTLAVRVTNSDAQRTTAWDLLGELPAFERTEARVGDLSYFVRPQGEAQFDALVSDDNPGNMAQIGEDEFHRIHAVLQRFYRMIIIDTGNNVRSPNWQAAVNAADVVVVVSTYQRDVGYSGSWVLDHLQQTGRERLATTAVTVLTAADPTTDKTVRAELLRHFAARTEAVVEIPYDPIIALGGPIRWAQLAAPTRRAWVQAGATVVRGLADRDVRRSG